MKVFSFCLYGTDPNYYKGLLENITIIKKYYPDFEIWVYKGICDPSWELKDVHVEETTREGAINMLYRYLPLSTAETGFVRDTDSRITERDRWCIDKFLESSYSYHIIRDHIYHKSKIMGGMFGWKKPLEFMPDLSSQTGYGHDEAIIAEVVYPQILSTTLVHTNVVAYCGEHSERITLPQENPSDFIGNVVWNGIHKFAYIVDPIQQVEILRSYDQFELMQFLSDTVDPKTVPYDKRTTFFDTAYISNYYLGNIEKAQYWLSQFEFAEVTPHIYYNSQFLLQKINKKLIASFDSERIPTENEIVIYYGNYPDWHLALPCSNRIYRHVSKFWDVQHDQVEYDVCWEPVETIYILNLEERIDRFYDTLLSLCFVRAPLHRIYHYKAKKDGTPAYIGATQNHVDCIKHFIESQKEVCLILEDDIVFRETKQDIYSTLTKFWQSKLDYNICFLSISKYGKREYYNDLVSITKQPCTTSAAYFLQKSTAGIVYSTALEGLEQMKVTGDHVNNCIDRYWSKLSNLFFFKTKFVFQRPSYSNLTGRVVSFLD